MAKYRIIGNMTGNSMDAIDLMLTEFDGNIMRDICTFSKPYSKNMQDRIEWLRANVLGKSRAEIENLVEFSSIHDDYIRQIAECIDEMCNKNNIDKQTIDAIGFHGKTLDHNPPSKARAEGSLPYTLQMGSGQMLADLTGIPVVYDFRSAPLMSGFDGAPLVPPHNAHISDTEGDGIYYNGGNTSNFAVIVKGKALIGADAGPFNEYVDGYIRAHTDKSFDENGMFGGKGNVNKDLLQKLFDIGRKYYEASLPKSGDPAYYYRENVFQYVKNMKISLEDAVRTFEYFAAYVAVQALSLISEDIKLPNTFILFGGGWKNPVVKESFEQLLKGKGFVLPEHQEQFAVLLKRFSNAPEIRNSSLGDYMEARLFADLARYKLEEKAWEIPEIVQAKKAVICGCVAKPCASRFEYFDRVNQAAKGWQTEQNKDAIA